MYLAPAQSNLKRRRLPLLLRKPPRVAIQCPAQLPRGAPAKGFRTGALEFLFARRERHRAFAAEGRRDLVDVLVADTLFAVDRQDELK